MPPWLGSPEAVAAFISALFALLASIALAVLGVIGAVIAAWRSKIKPLLTSTQRSAETAAEQLSPNHGSSAHDSLGRIELSINRIDRNLNQRITDMRADMRAHVDHSDRTHSDIYTRLHSIETPPEDTRP